jgi:adenylate cyclase
VYYLVCSLENSEPKTYQLQEGLNTIGRQMDNAIVIPDISVSRYHGAIELNLEEVYLKDFDSLNYTFVNGVQIRQTRIYVDDEICFGSVYCQLKRSGSEGNFIDRNRSLT